MFISKETAIKVISVVAAVGILVFAFYTKFYA